MILSRKKGKQFWGGDSSLSNVGGGGEGAGGASQAWVESNFVSIEFFTRLIKAYAAGATSSDPDVEIVPNDVESTVKNIKMMAGVWTEQYVSALGQGTGGSGSATSLADLVDVQINTSTLAQGQALVYDGNGHWVNGNVQSGTVTSVGMTVPTGLKVSPASITNRGTFAITFDTGYSIPTTAKQTHWDEEYSWVNTNKDNLAMKDWVGQNYLSIAFFARLFQAKNGNTNVNPNDTTTTIDSIKAMFGFWTDQYLSALGQGSGGSGSATSLSDLVDVQINTSTLAQCQALLYDGNGHWYNGTIQGGVDMTTVWNNLAAATNEQINASHLSTVLSGYLPLMGGTMLNTNLVTNLNSDLLDGLHAQVNSNTPWGTIPAINTSGWMEVGNSFEMHYDNTTGSDYSTRLYCTGNHGNSLALPSETGTLASQEWVGQQGFITSSGSCSHATTADSATTAVSATTAGSATWADKVYCTSHIGSWYLSSDYDGIGHFWLTAKYGTNTLPCAIDYATSAGSAGSATQLSNARTLWGQSFNGTANVSGSMTGVGDIQCSSGSRIYPDGAGMLYLGSSSNVGWIMMQDICSQDSQGDGIWSIRTNGIARFQNIYMPDGGRISCNDASSSQLYIGNSNDNGWVRISDMCSRQGDSYWKVLSSGSATFANVLSNGYVTALSDVRLKKVLGHVELTTEKIAKASAIRFAWKDGHDKREHVGGIAQEWQELLPQAVVDVDGRLSMDYSAIAYVSVVSLAKKVVAQQREIDSLKAENAKLEKRLERLEKMFAFTGEEDE